MPDKNDDRKTQVDSTTKDPGVLSEGPGGKVIERKPLPPVKNLVFEGGGVKGIAYVGALHELAKNNVLHGVERVAGSSAGGITAMLVALGYNEKEIEDKMRKLDFTKFQDSGKMFWEDVPPVGNLQKWAKKANEAIKVVSSKKHGLYKGDVLLAWARAIITEKFGDPNLTFFDLKKAIEAGKPGLKELMVTGSNISQNGMPLQYFDLENTPYVRIADAVRATMSFPGAFEPYTIDINGIPSTFVDGGLANNFPMEYYDDRSKTAPEQVNAEGINIATLGLRVDNPKEIQKYKWSLREYEGRDMSSLKGYLSGLVSVKLSDRDQVYKRGFVSVQIPDCGVETLNFELTEKQKKDLIDSGGKSTSDHFRLYRAGAYSAYKEYPSLLIYYRAKEPEELKSEQLDLIRGFEHLMEAARKETMTDEQRAKGQEFELKLAIVGKLLAAHSQSYEEKLMDNAKKLVSLQKKNALLSTAQLEKIRNENKEALQCMQVILTKLNSGVQRLEKATHHPKAKSALERIFVRLQTFNDDLRGNVIDLRKKEAAVKTAYDRDKVEQERLEFRTRGIEFLKADVEKELIQDSEVIDALGGIKNAQELKELIFIEIERQAQPEVALDKDRPKNLSEYYDLLKRNVADLHKQKTQLEVLNDDCRNRIRENHAFLRRIELEKKVYGKTPEAILKFSNKLEDFIISQKSYVGRILRASASLLGRVFPSTIYYGIKWISQKIFGEEAKKKFEAFENMFVTQSEHFVREAETLRDSARAILHKWKRVDALGAVEEYHRLLESVERRKGAAFIPTTFGSSEGTVQREFFKIVTPALKKAEKALTKAKDIHEERKRKLERKEVVEKPDIKPKR